MPPSLDPEAPHLPEQSSPAAARARFGAWGRLVWWAVAVGAGALVAAGVYWFITVPPGEVGGRTLSNLDQLASIVGAVVGLAGLLVAVIALRRSPPIPESPAPALPATSSLVPVSVASSAPVVVSELPAAPTGFAGRAPALRHLVQALNPALGSGAGVGTAVVVSAVAGMGGVGKTALALMAAHRVQAKGWFAGGVWFVNFHGYSPGRAERVEAAAAAGQLLRAWGVPTETLPTAGEEVLALYQALLTEQATAGLGVLVVADNVADAAQVQPLIPAQACHRLLVTSRTTLTLPARQFDLDVLDEGEAVDLLLRALAVRGKTDRRVAREPQAAAEIVTGCGYLPLAIQIIAAILAAEPERELRLMAGELAVESERLDVLQPPDQAPDQPLAGGVAGVRVSFELSYRRLLAQPGQARLFRLLPSAPGPDIGLEAVVALDGRPAGPVRRDLRTLVTAHLISLEPGERWAMHDLLRLYAGEQATPHVADDGREMALNRLFEHYRHYANAADDRLRALPGQKVPELFADRAAALAWFDTERVNLVAAVTAAHRAGRGHDVIKLTERFSVYGDWRQHLSDLLALASLSLSTARELGDRHDEGTALNSLGSALRKVRRFEEAITFLQGALAIYRELGDRYGEGGALSNLGNAFQGVRRFEEAITVHQDAIAIYRELGDRQSEGGALSNLGNAFQEVRRFEEAITVHQDAIAIYRELGDRHGEGGALNNLGFALRKVRRFEEAITFLQDALAIYRELGDRYGEGMALNNLGLALRGMRRFEEAITAHQDALTIFSALEDDYANSAARANLKETLRRRDEDAPP